MKFIIKPADNSFNMLLEANQYRSQWHQHSRSILKAFREITGLDFQQRVITARVFPGQNSTAGSFHAPMLLAGDNRSEDYKLLTMIHELCHRLLSGNNLGPVGLGLMAEEDTDDELGNKIHHRHSYLFEADVVERALGAEWLETCSRYEKRDGGDSPHDRAWKWVMKMSFEQRQEALAKLTAKAVTRKHWNDISDVIEPLDEEAWFKYLSNTTSYKSTGEK